MIYPEKGGAANEDVAARGPDDLGKGKRWVVSAPSGESLKVKLQIVDAKIMVSVESPSVGTKTWESIEGWERHSYTIAGTFSKWKHIAMEMDAMSPGLFQSRFKIGNIFYPDVQAFAESFAVFVDGDPNIAFYPEGSLSGSGDSICRGPDSNAEGRHFLAKAFQAGTHIEVTLDLTVLDKRKTLAWRQLKEEELELEDA